MGVHVYINLFSTAVPHDVTCRNIAHSPPIFYQGTMTDRLADLVKDVSAATLSSEIEAGLDDESEELLAPFNREAGAINDVLKHVSEQISAFYSDTSDAGYIPTQSKDLDEAESHIRTTHHRLKAIANDNVKFAQDHNSTPATARTRIVRCIKLGTDFVSVTQSLIAARDKHCEHLATSLNGEDNATIKQDDNKANKQQLNDGLDGIQSAEAHHQFDEVSGRNSDIQGLLRSITELKQLFEEMSIIIDAQQELINETAFNLGDAGNNIDKGNEQLGIAKSYQKRRIVNRMWVVILILVLVLVALAVLFTTVFRPR